MTVEHKYGSTTWKVTFVHSIRLNDNADDEESEMQLQGMPLHAVVLSQRLRSPPVEMFEPR